MGENDGSVRFSEKIRASVKRKMQFYLDNSVVWTKARWGGFAGLLTCDGMRVYVARGWYIVTYGLGIYASSPSEYTLVLAFVASTCCD